MEKTNRYLHWLLLLLVGLVITATNQASAQTTATLALSPTSSTVAINQNFTVNINLNTAGAPVDGVDIYSLHFNPAILQVVDSNTSLTGIQITSGSLLLDANGNPGTVINSADNTAGTIRFAQASAGGTSFTGSGVFATITFQGIVNGTSAVTFDFTAGNTSDTNVAYQGVDRLSSVTNASFTITTPDTTAPTVSLTAPTGGSTVSGTTVTVSANASDNVGVSGVQFLLDGANLGAEDTTSPYSIVWNTTTTTNASHSLIARARDAAGNLTTSTAVSVTVNNVITYQRTINIAALESRSSRVATGTLDVLSSPSKTAITSYPFTTNSAGNATITFNNNPTTVFLKIIVSPFLTRLLNLDLNNNVTYNFPQLLVGDINQDNFINSVDYSVVNTNWFTSNTSGDLNQDGFVNSIDFSFMNIHWLMGGEE